MLKQRLDRIQNATHMNLYAHVGKHCFIYNLPENKVLKVFNAYPLSDYWVGLEEFKWGDLPQGDNPNMSVKLIDACKIQNFVWLEGLAPRVYDIVKVVVGSQRYWGQVVEDMGTELAKSQQEAVEIYSKVKDLGKKYGFKNEKDDCSYQDVMQGKLVDFNTFHFSEDHLDKIKTLHCELGKYGKKYYQDIAEWGLTGGPRKSNDRIGYLGLAKINFINKTFVDLGCAGGFFCRYASDKGAKQVLGIDEAGHGSPDPVKAAYIAAIELGYWDIDFKDYNLETVPEKYGAEFDIVFFLSMNFHIGIPDWLSQITKEICVFEDNSKNRDAKETLEKMFREVRFIGESKDHGDKLIYHCYK